MAEHVRVKKLSKLKTGKPICVEHRGVPYVIINTKKGIKAYVSLCSHKNLAMFPPELKKDCLVCPYHKVRFSTVTGAVKDDQGKDVPDELLKVKTSVIEGVLYLSAKKKHRQQVPLRERRRIAKIAKKAGKQ